MTYVLAVLAMAATGQAIAAWLRHDLGNRLMSSAEAVRGVIERLEAHDGAAR